jgi:Glutathione S-transferase, N-terminal domain
VSVVLHRCRTRRVPWRKADRTDVDALTGQDRVPLLVIDRQAICDSRRIVEHLRWLSEVKASETKR